jgi:hypothetical protein
MFNSEQQHDDMPEWLGHLRDVVFEGLSAEHRAWWHVALAEALPVGVDLQPAYHQICIRILEDICLSRQEVWQEPYKSKVVKAIRQVIDYHREPTEQNRVAAKSKADYVVWCTDCSLRSADRDAAKSAAGSAFWSAGWYLVWSVESAAKSSAKPSVWKQIADIVIKALQEQQASHL